MSLLVLQNIQLSYGSPPLLDGVDLAIESGERICLIGRNGAGKSTLMKLICGELIPDDGHRTLADGVRISRLQQEVPEWEIIHDGHAIRRIITLQNHYEVMAFVNAVAWISHREDHHPTMTVGYSRCELVYSTHAVDGLTENDFICAAKVDALLL